MDYNKKRFQKINDKKILHKVKKQWVTISIALLGLISGSALITNVTAHADENNSNDNDIKQQLNKNIAHAQQNKLVSNQNQPQLSSSSNDTQTITQRANQLHANILLGSLNNKPKPTYTRNSNNITYWDRRPINITNISKNNFKRVNNLKHIHINQIYNFHNMKVGKINIPFHRVKITKKLLLHKNIEFNDNPSKSLKPNTIVNILCAYEIYGKDGNYYRYLINHNSSKYFITGNPIFNTLVQSHNSKFYFNRISHILHMNNGKNSKDIKAELRALNSKHYKDYHAYVRLYRHAFRMNNRPKEVTISNRINNTFNSASSASNTIKSLRNNNSLSSNIPNNSFTYNPFNSMTPNSFNSFSNDIIGSNTNSSSQSHIYSSISNSVESSSISSIIPNNTPNSISSMSFNSNSSATSNEISSKARQSKSPTSNILSKGSSKAGQSVLPISNIPGKGSSKASQPVLPSSTSSTISSQSSINNIKNHIRIDISELNNYIKDAANDLRNSNVNANHQIYSYINNDINSLKALDSNATDDLKKHELNNESSANNDIKNATNIINNINNYMNSLNKSSKNDMFVNTIQHSIQVLNSYINSINGDLNNPIVHKDTNIDSFVTTKKNLVSQLYKQTTAYMYSPTSSNASSASLNVQKASMALSAINSNIANDKIHSNSSKSRNTSSSNVLNNSYGVIRNDYSKVSSLVKHMNVRGALKSISDKYTSYFGKSSDIADQYYEDSISDSDALSVIYDYFDTDQNSDNATFSDIYIYNTATPKDAQKIINDYIADDSGGSWLSDRGILIYLREMYMHYKMLLEDLGEFPKLLNSESDESDMRSNVSCANTLVNVANSQSSMASLRTTDFNEMSSIMTAYTSYSRNYSDMIKSAESVDADDWNYETSAIGQPKSFNWSESDRNYNYDSDSDSDVPFSQFIKYKGIYENLNNGYNKLVDWMHNLRNLSNSTFNNLISSSTNSMNSLSATLNSAYSKCYSQIQTLMNDDKEDAYKEFIKAIHSDVTNANNIRWMGNGNYTYTDILNRCSNNIHVKLNNSAQSVIATASSALDNDINVNSSVASNYHYNFDKSTFNSVTHELSSANTLRSDDMLKAVYATASVMSYCRPYKFTSQDLQDIRQDIYTTIKNLPKKMMSDGYTYMPSVNGINKNNQLQALADDLSKFRVNGKIVPMSDYPYTIYDSDTGTVLIPSVSDFLKPGPKYINTVPYQCIKDSLDLGLIYETTNDNIPVFSGPGESTNYSTRSYSLPVYNYIVPKNINGEPALNINILKNIYSNAKSPKQLLYKLEHTFSGETDDDLCLGLLSDRSDPTFDPVSDICNIELYNKQKDRNHLNDSIAKYCLSTIKCPNISNPGIIGGLGVSVILHNNTFYSFVVNNVYEGGGAITQHNINDLKKYYKDKGNGKCTSVYNNIISHLSPTKPSYLMRDLYSSATMVPQAGDTILHFSDVLKHEQESPNDNQYYNLTSDGIKQLDKMINNKSCPMLAKRKGFVVKYPTLKGITTINYTMRTVSSADGQHTIYILPKATIQQFENDFMALGSKALPSKTYHIGHKTVTVGPIDLIKEYYKLHPTPSYIVGISNNKDLIQ